MLFVLLALSLALASWWRLGGGVAVPGLRGLRESGFAPIPTPATGFLDEASTARVMEQIASTRDLAGRIGTSDEALGQAYGELGKTLLAFELAGADAAFGNAARLLPEDYRWPYYLGYIELRNGRPDAAIAMLGEASRLAPSDLPSRLQLAEILIDSGRLDEAEPLLQEALARDAGYYWVYVLLGRLAAARSDHQAAVKYFERALELEPEAKMLKRPLAMSYRSLGDEARSAQLLEEAGTAAYVRYDPLLTELQGIRRTSQATMRQAGEMVASQPERALELVATAEAEDPDNPELFVIKAEALMRLNDLVGAAGAAQRASQLAPDGPLGGLAQLSLGTVLVQMGAYEGAEQAFRRAAELNPADLKSRRNLAELMRRSNRFDEAVPVYEEILESQPGDKLALIDLAVCLASAGRYGEAVDRLELANTSFAGDRDIADALARLLAAAPEDAVRDGARAQALAEANLGRVRAVDTVSTLAMAKAELGDFDGAVALQREAIDMAGREPLWQAWKSALEADLVSLEAGRAIREPWPSAFVRR